MLLPADVEIGTRDRVYLFLVQMNNERLNDFSVDHRRRSSISSRKLHDMCGESIHVPIEPIYQANVSKSIFHRPTRDSR